MPNVGVSSHFAFYFKVCDARQDEQAEHVSLRSNQMKEFEDALPERFHNTIQKTVVTIKEMKKKKKRKENGGRCSVQHRSYLFSCHVFVEC